MRLLKHERSGWVQGSHNFSLKKHDPQNIPLYAILSHRWGTDEITFQDIISGTARNKAGYRKLEFCAEQAAKDGLMYFWIDTCCIDKSSSAELSEAINSMFKWYKNATRCYVYLSDVPTGDDWESAFQRSDWFNRGWTLQELVAPAHVEFFSLDGMKLGDKKSLEQQISQLTGISFDALRGKPLYQIDQRERFSWTARRKTTIEEDTAYCLLGIFDVHMPLIYGEGQANAISRLQRKIDKSSRLGSIDTKEAPWIVPFERNSRFTGRETQLAELEAILFATDQTSKIAVTGLGGVGKTQLVLELLYRTRKKYRDCAIIWIPATTAESLQHGYRIAAQRLEIAGYEDEEVDVRKLVQDYLSKEDAGPWLLVFDNADDIDMWTAATLKRKRVDDGGAEQGSSTEHHRLIDYLPKNKRGCIVFTTRDGKAAVRLAQHNVVKVSEMSEEAATELLKKSLTNSIDGLDDVTTLLAALAYLPLAITQATAYINANGISLADYRSLLGEKEEEVIDVLSEEFEDYGRYHNVKNPIATTWLITFERIRKSDPLAAEYLSFMACIDFRDIPISLLPPGPSRKKEIEAIGTLTAYSFVNLRAADAALDTHRLVHLTMRNWLRKEELLAHCMEKAANRIEEAFPDHDYQNRVVWRKYLPHAQQVLAFDQASETQVPREDLMFQCAKCLFTDARMDEAERLFTQLSNLEIDTPDLDKLYILSYKLWLGKVYWEQGRKEEAERTEKEVMEIRMTRLGLNHPDTLRSMSLLSTTYHNQGRWEKAEELQLQILETRQAILAVDSLDALKSMATLARTYLRQGRWEEARKLDLQAVESCKAALGPDHLDTIASMSRLGLTYVFLGRLAEAEELLAEAIEAQKRKLGMEHPDTVESMTSLGQLYLKQGRLAEAEQVLLEVLDFRKTLYGFENDETLISAGLLAVTYREQRRLQEAAALQSQVLEVQVRRLGADHPDTLVSKSNLAAIHTHMGRLDEAEQLEIQLVQVGKTNLGADHPDTLRSITNLASIYFRQDRLDEAEELERQVLATSVSKLGEEHPDTLDRIGYLAHTCAKLHRTEEAIKLMRDCVQRQIRVLGATHPHVLDNQADLDLWEARKAIKK